MTPDRPPLGPILYPHPPPHLVLQCYYMYRHVYYSVLHCSIIASSAVQPCSLPGHPPSCCSSSSGVFPTEVWWTRGSPELRLNFMHIVCTLNRAHYTQYKLLQKKRPHLKLTSADCCCPPVQILSTICSEPAKQANKLMSMSIIGVYNEQEEIFAYLFVGICI